MINEKFQIHINNASVFLEQEDEDAAIKELDQALALVPNHAEAMLMRADAKRLRKLFSDALTDYKKASELGADKFRTDYGWGVTLISKYEFVEAQQMLDSALQANPKSAETLFWKGKCLFEQKKFDLAREAFEKSLELQVDPILGHSAVLFLRDLDRKNMKPMVKKPFYLFQDDAKIDSEYYDDAHPKAKELLPEAFYWSLDDFSPIGGDVGSDLMADIWRWRQKFSSESIIKFLDEYMVSSFGSTEQVQAVANDQLDLAIGHNSVAANLYDDLTIAMAYAQFMLDGFLDANLRTRALRAIERQSSSEVLEYRALDPDYKEARRRIKEGLLRMPISP